MNRQSFLKLAFALGFLSLAAGALPAAAENDPAPLRIAVYPGSLLSLPEYVGQDAGIYKKHNLNVSLLPIATGPGQIAAAASGSADIVGNTVGNALLANAQGQDLVIVTNSFNAPLYAWLKQPDYKAPNLGKPYPENIKDFKGAKIGISTRGSEVELFTRVLLSDAGLDPDRDVTWVPIGFGQTAIAAFEAKQVDIIVSIEPVQTILQSRGHAVEILDLTKGVGPKIFQNFPGQSRVARKATTESKKATFERYIAAQEEIINYISDPKNQDAVAAILAKNSGQPIEIAKTIVAKYAKSWGYKFDCGGYQNVVTYLVKSGQFKQSQADQAQSCKDLVAPVAAKLLVQ
jgi:NitT/TauT family transport system substrate-binding protein